MNTVLEATESAAQSVLRKLAIVWADFEGRLLSVPIIHRAMNDQLRIEDYRCLLADHYSQVKEGSGWISRAASSITAPYLEQRSEFLRHAVTEHRDYEMLERSFIACGGSLDDLRHAHKNVGSEALSAWMYHQASKPNPFDLLGAMFIIEGLGKQFANRYARTMQRHLKLNDEQVQFYIYHAEHDDSHLEKFETMLSPTILCIPGIEIAIIRTAKVTARLYLLQLEEVGRY
jgi:hypothetical protein